MGSEVQEGQYKIPTKGRKAAAVFRGRRCFTYDNVVPVLNNNIL